MTLHICKKTAQVGFNSEAAVLMRIAVLRDRQSESGGKEL